MPAATVPDLLEALGRHELLTAPQLQEVRGRLQARFPDSRALAKVLMEREWLTAYQINQLLGGNGAKLVLGPYVLLERLGEGGMGQVFKARHRVMDRIVALKIIRKDYLNNSQAIARFQREIKAAAQLAHPNIVAAHDAGQVDDTWLFAMEYVEGTDLAQRVRKDGPLPVAQACDYMHQTAQALQHAYEKGMVHRDIKPANLLVSREGVVKVLDMGLARLHASERDEEVGGVTAAGAVMGTPDYIAPEQARNSHTADIRSDLYSLGCSFYFLLTGKVPFAGSTLTEKLIKHQMDEPAAVEQVRPEVSPALAAVVRKLMAKQPADRFQTPAELVDALEPFLAVRPTTRIRPGTALKEITAAPPRAVPMPAVPAADAVPLTLPGKGRRGRWLAAAGIAAVLLVGLSTVALLAGRRSVAQGDPTQGAATEPTRSTSAPRGITQEWVKQVQSLPADKQVESVQAKLRDLNRGAEVVLKPGVDNGAVVRIELTVAGKRVGARSLTTLAPLYAFPNLKVLYLAANEYSGLSDLTSLQGLPLQSLHISHTAIRDLAFVKGMPLKQLDISHTAVLDLSPLQGMKLEILYCSSTKVGYLSTLRGMLLKELLIDNTPVADLTPLQGMPLARLSCSRTGVTDISPLTGLPLQQLDVSATRISDLTPLKNLPLKHLAISATQVSDIKPLQGMKLETFEYRGTLVKDVSVLREMPLRRVSVEFKPERDAEVFRAIKSLEFINDRSPSEYFKKVDGK
ncbi:MAG: protein kinase [Gemmataceae bacterium]|nr:protein kinase [Gemmataceae bacterium]